jgi:simple sugar transport system permease protein
VSTVVDTVRNNRRAGGIVAVIAVTAVLELLSGVPSQILRNLPGIITVGFVERSIVRATPITLTAVGALYAEKSGVFNIGVEGFMIFGAVGAAVASLVIGGEDPGQAQLWLALGAAVLFTLTLGVPFAVLMIRYKADQIVTGLAIWFIALGFAPFLSELIWGSKGSDTLTNMESFAIPFLADVPVLGRILFDASPMVFVTIVLTLLAWGVLYHTRYGYWVQAAGENPEALDTAGVNVTRVRYASVLFSVAMAGLGGAALFSDFGSFNGTGQTMVNGRGWIAIVAYLFGNYNPIGAAASALLFGGLDMLQVQFQTVGIGVPSKLIGVIPFIGVIIVLTLYGSTRVPSSVGEPYESED